MKAKHLIVAMALVAVGVLLICCNGISGIGSSVSVSGCRGGDYVQQMGARADSLLAQHPNQCFLSVEWEGENSYKVIHRTTRNCGRGLKANVNVSGQTVKISEHESGSGPLADCICAVDVEVHLTDVEEGTYSFLVPYVSKESFLIDLNPTTDTVIFVGGMCY